MRSFRLLVPLFAALNAFGRDELEPDHFTPRIPICEDTAFTHPDLDAGAEVLSVATKRRHNCSTPGVISHLPGVSNLNFCEVKVHLTHKGSNDNVVVEVWLPLSYDEWNGRFQATGGAGFATGMFDVLLGPAVKNGYAASSTDGGHSPDNIDDLSWALKADGTVDWDLLQTFASTSLAEQVVVGKSITEQFYGEKPKFSYWNGCSQGGRQGYVMAQKYPQLLDGILAVAPALSLVSIVVGDYWPQIAMKEAGILMSSCEFDVFRQKTLEECDMLDGVSDGVISDPGACQFDPRGLIGQAFYCDGKEVTITSAMAEVVRSIEQGPKTAFGASIWHGLPHGTNVGVLAGVDISAEGLRSPNPFSISSAFIQTLLLKDAAFNISKLSYGDYMALWAQANYEYDWILHADTPDLSPLLASGTKLLTWHGINDQLIPYQNTVRYRERVESVMGGAHEVDKFYRLFLAPGVEHCGGGLGPVPKDPLAALVEWVENEEAPETLEAAVENSKGELVTRALCAWPGKTKYMGVGDAKRASTWSCVGGTERPELEYGSETNQNLLGRAGEVLGSLKDRLEGLGMGLRIG